MLAGFDAANRLLANAGAGGQLGLGPADGLAGANEMSKPRAACLALWGLGMIVARSCSLTAVAWAWVPILQEKFYTLRERLRDFYRQAPANAGPVLTRSQHKGCGYPENPGSPSAVPSVLVESFDGDRPRVSKK